MPSDRHDRIDRHERPDSRTLAEWTRSVMSARPARLARPRRVWHLDAPAAAPPDDDPAPDLSWFASSLALARGLVVIEHAQVPDAAALEVAVAAGIPAPPPVTSPVTSPGTAPGTSSGSAPGSPPGGSAGASTPASPGSAADPWPAADGR